MPSHVRLMIEERELSTLSPHAAKAALSAGRAKPEDDDPVRTCFQRDRDRILHSKPFRRLKHKTQVFLDPVGDHYRTRLTHTLEVAQIARTVGRALRLNEDLIEAIALGHDVGHPPFGHAGEAAVDEVLQERFGGNTEGIPDRFRHHEQSLRVVDHLCRLNLTQEVRSGIGGHSKGEKDLGPSDGEPTSTLEASVVRICDRIAYVNHDLDDALRSGLATSIPEPFASLGQGHGERIGAMVVDLVSHSLDSPVLRMSDGMFASLNEIKDWLFENVYHRYPKVFPDITKAKRILQELFIHYLQPGALPDGYTGVQGAIDYVAGMTDRFAIHDYTRLFIPSGFDDRIESIL